MIVNIRYRLIQILEIILWLGAAAGLGTIVREAWGLRDQGSAAMLDTAGPGLLAGGAIMAALIVLIGVYHNGRRNADAMERLLRQGTGISHTQKANTGRRLPGATRTENAAQPATVLHPTSIPEPAAPKVAPATPVTRTIDG
ncbi:MAG: hypothetical protein ACK5II_06630 [Paracoccus sp. (in: a-proteobacteria)]